MFTLYKFIDWLFPQEQIRESVPNLVIRAATIADAEAIMRLRKAADKDRRNRNPPLDPYGGQYPTVEQEIEDIVKFGESGLFLVAEVGKEIIGTAFVFEMHATVGDYRLRLVVDRKWRRKGIGTALASYIVA
jgi:GNAT superfamily N-acetyltransferase